MSKLVSKLSSGMARLFVAKYCVCLETKKRYKMHSLLMGALHKHVRMCAFFSTVRVDNSMNNSRCASSVEMKTGNAKVLIDEEWGANSGVLCLILKFLRFILFHKTIKNTSKCA